MRSYKSVGGPEDEVKTQIELAKNSKIGIVELGVLFGETSGTLLNMVIHINSPVNIHKF